MFIFTWTFQWLSKELIIWFFKLPHCLDLSIYKLEKSWLSKKKKTLAFIYKPWHTFPTPRWIYFPSWLSYVVKGVMLYLKTFIQILSIPGRSNKRGLTLMFPGVLCSLQRLKSPKLVFFRNVKNQEDKSKNNCSQTVSPSSSILLYVRNRTLGQLPHPLAAPFSNFQNCCNHT